MSLNYYNDNDPYVAQWLRNLIKAGLIPDGIVDDRPIQEIKPNDLKDFNQCHFFAGIGGWSLALRLAGWPEDRQIWTGSCPCQPFSVAGKGKGEEDERHLWPAFRELIAKCKPPVVFGEQVASVAGRVWLAGVRLDLEGMGYAVGGADLCAAGIGAPHIRQRLFWVAESPCQCDNRPGESRDRRAEPSDRSRMGHPESDDQWRNTLSGTYGEGEQTGRPSGNSGMENSYGNGSGSRRAERERQCGGLALDGTSGDSGIPNTDGFGYVQGGKRQVEKGQANERPELPGELPIRTARHCHDAWSDYILVPCLDGKARRLKSGLAPLVDGIPRGMGKVCPENQAGLTSFQRVGMIKGYGNAIVPQLAAEFIAAYMEVRGIRHKGQGK